MATEQPIGIRLNNPGNIEWGSPWQGLVPREKSMYANTGSEQQKRFCQFKDPTWGIRALCTVLITYQDKRRAADGSKIDSIAEIMARWAPTHENDTQAYAKIVAAAVGVAPDDETVDVHDYDTLKRIVEAIIRHENGAGPLATASTWYDDAVVEKGLLMAGVKPPVRVVTKVPVTKETVAGSAVGALGLVQLADIAPRVMDAINTQTDKLSSGSTTQVVVAVIMIGLAVFIAYSQIVKHNKGVL